MFFVFRFSSVKWVPVKKGADMRSLEAFHYHPSSRRAMVLIKSRGAVKPQIPAYAFTDETHSMEVSLASIREWNSLSGTMRHEGFRPESL
jgi:hypothetical protein